MEGKNSLSPVTCVVKDAQAGIFRVGPNAVLSGQGLFVSGERTELRHIEDFRSFVFSTSAAVCEILECLFPQTAGMPSADGTAVPSRFAGWELYADRVMKLRAGIGDPREHGETLLQWCLAAWCVVAITEKDIGTSPEFLPINLLLSQGGRALATSVKQWEDYDNWRRIGSFQPLLAGKDELGDPRPRAVVVTIPWPEALGADLGSRDRLFESVTRIASDIEITRVAEHVTSRLAVAGHYVAFESATVAALVDEFDKQATTEGSALITIEIDGVTFRSQRVVHEPSTGTVGAYYVFRIITRPDDPRDISRVLVL
ncbi:hypothetical protein [Burkholderia cepacia]|uniref:hypothetical protein n=1 Tax=Burkholderia cepacia TaxID=292 RepID=UPI002AB69EAC|nr:hypothetical protein [Burkholderia cepacia]